MLLHQANAPSHTNCIAMATTQQSGFELMDHSLYAPDLAPSDYKVNPNLKENLRGKKFQASCRRWFSGVGQRSRRLLEEIRKRKNKQKEI